MTDLSPLRIGNAAFLDALYHAWRRDPASVDPEWRTFFAGIDEGTDATPLPPRATPDDAVSEFMGKQMKVIALINANRYRGHRGADLDPIKVYERPPIPELYLEYHGFGEDDLDRTFNTGTLHIGKPEATLREIDALLRDTYRGPIGIEVTHLSSTGQKRWVQERLEGSRGRPGFDAAKKRDVLRWVTAARKLEDYLHRKYVGQKRFSLEGGENLIPLLDEIVQDAGRRGVREAVIGMAHRGRLNVLVNILGKHPKVLFGEFEGKIDVGSGSGDVKYHLGFSSTVETPGGPLHLVLAFNPSHLEIINPVVEGSVRARQERRGDSAGERVLPILVHGDAAFSGQGVVTETLNLSETPGYRTGGTVHVVVNNQIGFTTSDPRDSRSTLYCTDIAKLVQAPIFHVNGNDAEAVVFIAQIALDFRMRFKKDVVIDMVCFRRYGHNEADEPLATQPMMYKKVRNQPGPAEGLRGSAGGRGRGGARRAGGDVRGVSRRPGSGSRDVEAARRRRRGVPRRLDALPRVRLAGALRHHGGHRAHRAPRAQALRVPGRRLRAAPQREADHRRAALDGPRRAADGLGVRGKPRLRHPAGGRLLGAPVRPGQPARHVLPPPRGAAQPAALRHLDAAGAPVRGPAPVPGHQLHALGGRGPRVRVRLLHRRAGGADHLGGAVRGLRERRPGGHRPVPELFGGEVGAVLRARADAPARLRRARARAFLGPPRTLPPALRGGEHAGLRCRRPPRRCSTSSGASSSAPTASPSSS